MSRNWLALPIVIIYYSIYYVSVLSISTQENDVENSKATHQVDGATILEVFWEGTLITQELPADTDYVEVEAPCPEGCSWKIREETIEERGLVFSSEQKKLVCFLEHKGVDISGFFTSGMQMIVRLPAGSPIVLTFR